MGWFRVSFSTLRWEWGLFRAGSAPPYRSSQMKGSQPPVSFSKDLYRVERPQLAFRPFIFRNYLSLLIYFPKICRCSLSSIHELWINRSLVDLVETISWNVLFTLVAARSSSILELVCLTKKVPFLLSFLRLLPFEALPPLTLLSSPASLSAELSSLLALAVWTSAVWTIVGLQKIGENQ